MPAGPPALLEGALPASSTAFTRGRQVVMARGVTGMDPHKWSARSKWSTSGSRWHWGQFRTDRDGYRDLLAAGWRYGDRVWCVEGADRIRASGAW